MHGGGRDGQGNPRYPDWNAISDIEKEAQARDAPWSCGNQPAYHSMINRRSVPALHRACLHHRWQPKHDSGWDFTSGTLETDMTVRVYTPVHAGMICKFGSDTKPK
jgi:hypothetical protein